jgi:hypothetical protein
MQEQSATAEVKSLSTPATLGIVQPFGGINYSALNAAQRCLQLYKYQYLDKLPQPAPESGDMAFGTAMHAGVQALLENADGISVFTLYWDSEKDKDLAYGRFKWVELREIGIKLLTRFERLHKKKFKPVSIETRLYSHLGGYRVEGTPDFIGYVDEAPSVVDFKTSGSVYNKDKIVCSEQMYLYAYMAKQELQFPATQLVYYVFCKAEERIQVITYELTEEKLKAMLNNIVMQCDELVNRKAFPKNRNSCLMGSIKCPYWSECYGSK